jgi:predicted transcriptional regulator
MQMLQNRWLVGMADDCGQKKFKTTEKGLVFLEKYWELQNIMGTKNKQMSIMTAP